MTVEHIILFYLKKKIRNLLTHFFSISNSWGHSVLNRQCDNAIKQWLPWSNAANKSHYNVQSPEAVFFTAGSYVQRLVYPKTIKIPKITHIFKTQFFFLFPTFLNLAYQHIIIFFYNINKFHGLL